MRIILILLLTFSFFGDEFKSYDAKFAFETKFGDFPLKRYFTAKDNEINTRVKMQVFWLKYSIDSNFRIEGKNVISVNTIVQDPFRDEPKKFSANFSQNMIASKELENIELDRFVLEQLASDVQVRINAKYGVTDYVLNIFDNTKGEVVSKNYRQLDSEIVETLFGAIETIVVLATSENVGPIKYFIAPTMDYLIIKSTATLKNGEERVLIISEMPKFLEE
ncbi:MAG: hypothetical protein ACJ0GK_04185 [Gammaproteobacteria bacterium]|tara:strand:- start:4335 stop:4997 length:663 start_codon:yes stop_codon:yes gene_type:complete